MELIIYQHPAGCWKRQSWCMVWSIILLQEPWSGKGRTAFPKDRLRSIQASACSGMDPEDPGFGSISRMCPWKGSATTAPAWVAPCFTAI